MKFTYDDGGRAAAGFKGSAGDCVVRAIAIASGKPYREVYEALHVRAKERKQRTGAGKSTSPRNGVARSVYEHYLMALGFKRVPTMQIGSGCKVHLVAEELPKGTLIVRLSKHLTTVIDGVIHDTFNPQRGATYWYGEGEYAAGKAAHVSPDRCVYGYYTQEANQAIR